MSAITPSQVKSQIEAGIPEGKSLIQQHQLVYGAVSEAMASGAIHALALKTYTPKTWQAAN
jgi:stress-induced morphogen